MRPCMETADLAAMLCKISGSIGKERGTLWRRWLSSLLFGG